MTTHATWLVFATLLAGVSGQDPGQPKPPAAAAASALVSSPRHTFFVAGPTCTGIFDERGEIAFDLQRPGARDGVVLPNGNVLVAWSDVVLETTRERKVVFRYERSADNQELGTVWRLDSGRTLVSELGKQPRLLELTADGKVAAVVALQPDTDNAHMQTRMARPLANGHYLVPHLLAFAVKEYDASGKVLSVLRTDLEELGGRKAENWPFTAIRLADGNTLVGLTHGNRVVEFAANGTVAWSVGNDDLPGRPIVDACGVQRLPDGNTVIASYAATEGMKLFEVDKQKKIVWSYSGPHRVHHFQVLTTDGKPLPWPPLK